MNSLKKFTRIAVALLIVGVIAVCFLLKFAFNTVSGLITGGVGGNPIVSVTNDGVSIADMIKIDDKGIEIGGSYVDFSKIGEQVSSGLESAGIVVSEGMSGSLGSGSVDVTDSDFHQNRYSFDASLNRALDIDVDNCDVVIASGDSEAIVVDVLESGAFTYKMSTSDNTLVIRDSIQQTEEKSLSILGFKISLGAASKQTVYTGLAMIIYLPESFDGEIKLVTNNGDIKLGNLKLTESIAASTSNGSAELTGVEAYDVDIATSNGRITLDNISATEISAATTNERVTLSGLVAKRLDVSTSSASIDFSRLFGEKFSFTTSNGDISGSILGQESLFSIITETDRAAFPKTSENERAQYKLNAVTSGGDINIRFVE